MAVLVALVALSGCTANQPEPHAEVEGFDVVPGSSPTLTQLPVNITYSFGNGSVDGFVMHFGDGETVGLDRRSGTLAHTYRSPGEYVPSIWSSDGEQVAVAGNVTVWQEPVIDGLPESAPVGSIIEVRLAGNSPLIDSQNTTWVTLTGEQFGANVTLQLDVGPQNVVAVAPLIDGRVIKVTARTTIVPDVEFESSAQHVDYGADIDFDVQVISGASPDRIVVEWQGEEVEAVDDDSMGSARFTAAKSGPATVTLWYGGWAYTPDDIINVEVHVPPMEISVCGSTYSSRYITVDSLTLTGENPRTASFYSTTSFSCKTQDWTPKYPESTYVFVVSLYRTYADSQSDYYLDTDDARISYSPGTTINVYVDDYEISVY